MYILHTKLDQFFPYNKEEYYHQPFQHFQTPRKKKSSWHVVFALGVVYFYRFFHNFFCFVNLLFTPIFTVFENNVIFPLSLILVVVYMRNINIISMCFCHICVVTTMA